MKEFSFVRLLQQLYLFLHLEVNEFNKIRRQQEIYELVCGKFFYSSTLRLVEARNPLGFATRRINLLHSGFSNFKQEKANNYRTC